MKGVIIALALFAVSAYAQIDCPDCGPPVLPPYCQLPDCSIPANHQNIALFSHTDPNYYWQCAPQGVPAVWAPVARPCACGTHFNPFVNPPRCTFWFESSWRSICGWARPPPMRPCEPWCPDCGGGDGGDVTAPTQSPTTTVAPPTPPNCNCPCVPCIWWPCVPCNPCQC